MAKTDWNMNDTVLPEDMNQIGEELNKTHEQIFHDNTTQTQLQHGTQLVEASRRSLASVGFKGKTVVNYVPLFDSGAWTLHANVTVDSPTKITLNATDWESSSSISLQVKDNTTYTLSAKVNGDTMRVLDVDYDVIAQTTGLSVTFETGEHKNIIIQLVNAQTQSGTNTWENIMLNEGAEAQEFVANVKHLHGVAVESTGKNLIPPFYDWSLHANAKVLEPYKLELNATGNEQVSHITVKVIPNQAYILSTGENSSGFQVFFLDEEKQVISGIYQPDEPFITPSDCRFIRVETLQGGETGTFTFETPQLELGAVATDFEPHKKSYAYIKDKIGQWDELYPNGELLKGGEYDVELTGELGWTYSTRGIGWHRVYVPSYFENTSERTQVAVKYNGVVLRNIFGSPTEPDVIHSGSVNLNIGIASDDSGWGDNYTPTAAEIKAYFNGWKMGVQGSHRTAIYNGTGDKVWYKITRLNDNISLSGTNDFTNTLPTEPAGTDALGNTYTPYKLSYKLAQPYIKKADIEGDLQVFEGNNHINLYEGVVVRERAIPYYFDTFGLYFINRINWSELDFKVAKFIEVYKNNKPDIFNWDILSGQWGYGKAYLRSKEGKFDPTATYYVTYLVLDKHLYTARIDEATLQYQASLKSVVDDHTERIGELQTMQEVIAPIAMDSQIVETGRNANGEYVRWANGWQICRQQIQLNNISVSTSSGSIYQSDNITWTYPAPFISTAQSFASIADWGSNWIGSSGESYSKSQYVYRIMRGISSVINVQVGLYAIGRWK